jgi:hypothetical protein
MSKQNIKINQIVYDNIDFLKNLAKTRSLNKQKEILHKANTSQLLALAEICLNIVKTRFILTNRQKKRLLPYADFVRKLSRVRSEKAAKKVVQKGTGSASLFSALLTPIIIELTKYLLESKKDVISK